MKSIEKEKLWRVNNNLLRDPIEIVSGPITQAAVDQKQLKFRTKGNFFEVLEKLDIRLLLSREYEHLLLSLGFSHGKKEISFMPTPHPSGIAVDESKKEIIVASTRNPNQIISFAPIKGMTNRIDIKESKKSCGNMKNPLFPVRTDFYSGSLYMHELGIIGEKLYANAVGHNAIVELLGSGKYKYAWWPKCVGRNRCPDSRANYIQLNSIAVNKTIKDSFFSASSEKKLNKRPGDINYPVDGRGVIFSGKTREPICYGLTRPHSARFYNGKIFVDNSGYGELGFVNNKKFERVIKLPGWTRGLCIRKNIAFVGLSRVIPRFHKYAPGLDVRKSVCGLAAIDLKTAKEIGRIEWPYGNQIFSVECVSRKMTDGFMFSYEPRIGNKIENMFYAFNLEGRKNEK